MIVLNHDGGKEGTNYIVYQCPYFKDRVATIRNDGLEPSCHQPEKLISEFQMVQQQESPLKNLKILPAKSDTAI